MSERRSPRIRPPTGLPPRSALSWSANRPIDVYDENALAEAGWMVTRQAPDYAGIRKALHAGEMVEWRGRVVKEALA